MCAKTCILKQLTWSGVEEPALLFREDFFRLRCAVAPLACLVCKVGDASRVPAFQIQRGSPPVARHFLSASTDEMRLRALPRDCENGHHCSLPLVVA